MIRKILFVFFSFCFVFASEVSASDEKYITIVNPVRISKYTKNPPESLAAQYKVIKQNDLPATWLFTYDALNNKKIIDVVNKMNKFQEIGLFLEITPAFATDSGVKYHDSGFWHHANSVFLSGYTQEERIKLVDKIFEKYKEVFAKYPKSIGGWWTDAYSLNYIKEKYGVVANLVCADQFSTDGYKIWGQPWQIPYYSSKNHPTVPASNIENKLDLVNIQWASRDPLNGYKSSLYSTQDYLVTENVLDTNYFKKLLDLYLDVKDLGHITVGLEADLDPSGYAGEFAKQIETVKKYFENGVQVVTMSQFYEKYKEKYPSISPSTEIKSEDLLESKKEAVWQNNSSYRLFYTTDLEKNVITINDLRVYDENIIDSYYVSPNSEFNLSINIPSIIDSIQNQDDVWILPREAEIITNETSIVIKGKNIKIPKKIKNNPLANIKINNDGIEISFNKINFNSSEGDIIKGFTSEAIHFFKTKKSILKLLIGDGWEHFNKVDYLVPQSEIYALLYLKSQNSGKVLVYDGECLQCEWHTKNKPVVFSNQRNYVKKYTNHPIVYNSSFFSAKTIEDAKKEFKKVNPKYVYLVKFEEYIEKLPFSPGDFGLTKIYSNANAEVWMAQ